MSSPEFKEYRFSDVSERLVVPAICNDPYMGLPIPAEGSYSHTIVDDVPDVAIASSNVSSGFVATNWRYMERQLPEDWLLHREHVEIVGDFSYTEPDEFGTSGEIYKLSDAIRGSMKTAFGVTMFDVGCEGGKSSPMNGLFSRKRYVEEFPFTTNTSGAPVSPWISVLDIYKLRSYVWSEGPARTSITGETLTPTYNPQKRPLAVFASAKIVFNNPDIIQV